MDNINTPTVNVSESNPPINITEPQTEVKETNPKRKGKRLVFVLIFIIILLIGVITYLILTNKTELTSIDNETNQGEDNQEIETKILDCNSDFDCFIEASKNCIPSKVLMSQSIQIFEVTEEVTSYLEIRGFDSEKCILYIRTQDIELTFPTETSKEIVEEQESIYDQLEGKEGICNFSGENLTNLLRNWKEGNYSSEDFSSAECEGTMFDNN